MRGLDDWPHGFKHNQAPNQGLKVVYDTRESGYPGATMRRRKWRPVVGAERVRLRERHGLLHSRVRGNDSQPPLVLSPADGQLLSGLAFAPQLTRIYAAWQLHKI